MTRARNAPRSAAAVAARPSRAGALTSVLLATAVALQACSPFQDVAENIMEEDDEPEPSAAAPTVAAPPPPPMVPPAPQIASPITGPGGIYSPPELRDPNLPWLRDGAAAGPLRAPGRLAFPQSRQPPPAQAQAAPPAATGVFVQPPEPPLAPTRPTPTPTPTPAVPRAAPEPVFGTETAAVPPPPPPPPPRATEAAYGVHLASYRVPGNAGPGWATLQRAHPNVLAGKEPVLREVDLGARGRFTRLIASPFADREAARQACREIRKSSEYCKVLRLRR